MVAITVADAVNQNEWHLPTYDPRNENKYHYKLQSLDIYFWTQQDALQFINGVRRVLPASQVEVLDEPGPPQGQQSYGMQSVVQKLENVAISDPRYGNVRNSQDATVLATQQPQQPQQQQTQAAQPNSGSTGPASGQLPPPPPPPGPPPAPAAPANFAPIAYNPAAPAAPETIQHREKTPPPDEDPLNPLAVAVAHDYQGQPFTPAFPSHAQYPPGLASPGLPMQGMASPRLPPPPSQPQPGLHRAATMPVQNHPGLTGAYTSSSHGASPAPQHSTPQPSAPGTLSPLASPGLPQAGQSGFSNYTYSHQQAPHGPMDYSIHQQVYVPTAAETGAKPAAPYAPKQEGRGKLEENAARFERGVSGMFKKFEKKFG